MHSSKKQKTIMKECTFHCLANVTVKASSEEEARKLLFETYGDRYDAVEPAYMFKCVVPIKIRVLDDPEYGWHELGGYQDQPRKEITVLMDEGEDAWLASVHDLD